MEAYPELVPHSGLLCMMVVHRGTHTSHSSRCKLAQLNHWTEVEKATLLVVSVRGAALPVLSNLPADRRSDYRVLVTALENCFGTTHQAELHRMKLRNRTRKRDESLAEPMEDIERPGRGACHVGIIGEGSLYRLVDR